MINTQLGSFSLLLNHLIIAEEFFHWLTCMEDVMSLLIWSRTVLLTLKISDFNEFISLSKGLCRQLSL